MSKFTKMFVPIDHNPFIIFSQNMMISNTRKIHASNQLRINKLRCQVSCCLLYISSLKVCATKRNVLILDVCVCACVWFIDKMVPKKPSTAFN